MKGYLPHTDFDYAAVEGSDRPIMDDEDAIKSEVNQRLVVVVETMFRWITDCRIMGVKGQARIGRRFIALAWVVNPSLFECGPSLRSLALRLGVHVVTMSRLTAEVSRQFGVSNPAQQHDWKRGKRHTKGLLRHDRRGVSRTKRRLLERNKNVCL